MAWLGAVALILTAFFSAYGIQAQPNLPLPKVKTGQEGATKNASPSLEIPIKEQLANAKKRLSEAKQDLAGINKENQVFAGSTKEEVDEYKNMHERLIQLYEMQTIALEQMQILDADTGTLRQRMTSWTGFEERPPYPLELGDNIWREIRSTEQDIQTLRIALLVFEKDLADAKELLKPSTLAMQQSAEHLNEIKPDEDASRSRWLLELNQLRLRMAEVEVAMQETQRRMINSRIAAKEMEQVFLSRKLDVADAYLHFSQQDLDAKIDKLEREQLGFQKEIERAKRNDQTVFLEHSRIQQRLDRLHQQTQTSPDTGSGAAAEIMRLEQLALLLQAQMDAVSYQRRALSEMVRANRQSKGSLERTLYLVELIRGRHACGHL